MMDKNILLSALILMSFWYSGILSAAKYPDAVEVYEEKITQDMPLPSSKFLASSINIILRNHFDITDWDKHFADLHAAGISGITVNLKKIRDSNCGTLTAQPNLDELDEVLKAAVRQKMKVWIDFNWNLQYSKNKNIEADFTSRKYIEGQYLLIDAIAEKNKKYGNIVGMYWDEIWCAELYHLHPNSVDSFKQFCKKEYNEEYPGSKMPIKPDPRNKWWRRFVVFKYCVYENFSRKIYDYSKKKGFKVMTRTAPSQAYGGNAWKWGLDSYRIGKIGDCNAIFTSRSYEGDINENSVMSGYKELTPLDFVWMLRGYPLTYFTYSLYLRYESIRTQFIELTKLAKEWIGAERLAEVAILNYPVNLIGSFKNPAPVFRDNEALLTSRLSRYFETDRIDIRDTRLYKKYKVLIAPKYSGNSIPAFACQGLLKYIKEGGILLALDADFSVGKRDLTNPRNINKELCGIEIKGKQSVGTIKFSRQIMGGAVIPGKNRLQQGIAVVDRNKIKIIATSNNQPVITEYCLGEGKVVYVKLDLAKRIKEDNKWLRILAGLVNYYHMPAVTSNGMINIESAIKKNDRLMVSLFPATEGEVYVGEVKPTDQPGDIPSVEKSVGEMKGVIRIDPKKLGLNAEKYQVFRLSECKLLPKNKNELYWGSDDLRKGIPVTITKEAGYENIVIEKAGTVHGGKSILAVLKAIRDKQKEDIRQGKLHPLGLRKEPFRSRIEVEKTSSKSPLKWASAQPYRISLNINNPLNTVRPGEPIIISGAELLKAADGKKIQKDSFRVYQANGDKQAEIASQLDSMQREDKFLDKKDELVFVATLNPGKNDFLIYCSSRETKPTDYQGIKLVTEKNKKGKSIEIITTGLTKIKLNPKGQMQIYDEAADLPVVELTAAGDRYAGWSYHGNGKCKWLIKGPVHCRAVLDTRAKRDTFHIVYDFYYGSPFIKAYYSSNEKAIVKERFYWPFGRLLGKSSSASVLTDKGWRSVTKGDAWNLKPFKDNVKTAVNQGDTATQFGFLLAHSNIVIPPHLLVSKSKGNGYFYIEFSKYHCGAYTPVDNPEVEWVYVHGAGHKQIDSYAQRLKKPLIVKLGTMENK
ncbi:MAG: hypothetical protein PHV82_05785 [Victivallaceae bacterium]|nr:hypothetical protein [Victivallaceae bacterium]